MQHIVKYVKRKQVKCIVYSLYAKHLTHNDLFTFSNGKGRLLPVKEYGNELR